MNWKKIVSKFEDHKLHHLNPLWWWFGLILTLMVLWPLGAASYFSHHDDVQVIRLHQMNKCWQDGQIPCRWVPDLGGLYGYPLFNYYGPLPYYFGQLVLSLSNDLIFSAKAMFAITMIGSYAFMYLAARRLWGHWGGVISGIFYVYAPYHAVDIYVRGAMGELWGLMFYPGMIWALLRLRSYATWANGVILALMMAGLVMSHNLSALIFVPLFGVISLLLLKWKPEAAASNKRYIIALAISFALGLMLAGFYWLPMVAEKNLVHVDSTTSGYFGYTEHFKGFRKLLVERTWGWGASIREVPGVDAKDDISYQVGWIHLLAIGLSLLGLPWLWKKQRYLAIWVGVCLSGVVISLAMIHPRSQPVWDLLEPLKYLQFPWRFLGMVIFWASLMAGSIMVWCREKLQTILGMGLILLVVTLNFGYFRPLEFYDLTAEQMLSGKNWDKLIKRSIFDYLPIYAEAPPAELAPAPYNLETGDADIINFQKGTDWYRFEANVKSHTIIRLAQYYFPNWVVKVNAEPVNIDYNNPLGLMQFILGTGQYTIEAKLEDTVVRKIGNLMTVIGMIIVVIITLVEVPKFRRWLMYYARAFTGK